jgi:hypothetical protein
VSNHALAANLQPVPLLVNPAPAHSGQNHFFPLFVVQVNACFQASEALGHLVNDTGNELIEIENGRNSLRGLLHTLQIFDQVGWQVANRDFASGKTGNRSHRESAPSC